MTRSVLLMVLVGASCSGIAFFVVREFRLRASAVDNGVIGALRSRTVAPCEVSAASGEVIRARILGWGTPTKHWFTSTKSELPVMPVEFQVLEQVRGLSGPLTRTAYVVGPADPLSGQFIDGVLVRNQEVYVSVGPADGLMLIAGQGFWPVATGSVRQVTSGLGVVDEGAFRRSIDEGSPCDLPDPSPTQGETSVAQEAYRRDFDAGVAKDGGP